MEAPDGKRLDRSHIHSQTLYLLDAMALAYRSHFIFISRPLINSKGQNTSAAYGFTMALLKLIEEHKMDHIIVVFDAIGEGGTFRDEIYAQYKAHRSPMPEDLADNIPRIKRIVNALDIPVVEIGGVEADDVIGTLARRAEAEGADVVIVSPDKDFQQLLTPRISIFRPAHRGEEFDPITPESFREKFGVEPRQFIDILALMGDSSDNVPGVPGIGEKTATQLIKMYGSVENLLAHVDEVKGKRAKEGLQQYHEDALLSKKLVTIDTDVAIDFDWKQCVRGEPDIQALGQIFTELEFGSLLRRLDENRLVYSNVPEVQEVPQEEDSTLSFDFGPYEKVQFHNEEDVEYHLIRNRKELEAFVSQLEGVNEISFDTETTSSDQMWASLVGMSFSWNEGEAWYIPLPLPDKTTTEEVLRLVGPLLQGKKIIGHNLKYDIVVLKRHGVELTSTIYDTMVAHYLVAPEEPHGLDVIARRYLNYKKIPITSLIGEGKNQLSMRDVPIEDVATYACEDADITLRLSKVLDDILKGQGLSDIAERIEFPLVGVLAEMELTGISVDSEILQEISEQLTSEIKRLESAIYKSAGQEFNIGSTQQLGEILFNKLGLNTTGKTSTGRPSTKESVLLELCTEHELPCLVLDWRHISKLKSTYVDSLGDLIHPETRRIHTSFNQTITATGRLSSSGPNLQNIPVRTELGREIRKAFVPAEGWKMVAADYVQIELRILASMSGDSALKEAFKKGEDVHTSTASRVFGIPPEQVTRDQRRKAKEINYGIPYGVSAWGLAQRLRTSVQEAQMLIDQYQQSYPQVNTFLNELIESARQKGFAETMLGRKRYIPGINARNRNERAFSERVAVNMPIQGTQADMIKIAMVRLSDRMKKEKLKGRMLLQVHDELVFESPVEEIEYLQEMIREEMSGALKLEVPVEVEINVADNWLDAH